MKRELTSAISRSHGVRVSDLVMVAPGSIPITTSGKIRRSSCMRGLLHGRDGFARLGPMVLFDGEHDLRHRLRGRIEQGGLNQLSERVN